MLFFVCLFVCLFMSLTNSRGSRVQSRGRGSNVAAGENDLEFEVTE